jgi:hypothetical protein
MPFIIPNITASPQTVSSAQIVVNGTTCTWPADKIVDGVPVLHHVECSIGVENTGTVPAELKFTFQREIGSGWEDVAGEVACYTIAAGDDARRKTNFKVPYYTGISGFIPRYRLLAECPAGEVTLHRAEGRDTVPTVTGKQEHEFEGEEPVVEEIDFALEAQIIGTSTETGDVFGEANESRQFFAIEGNRFVWAGSRRPGGEFPRAQTVVGSATEDGTVTYGTLSEDTLGWSNALSSDTYGVCAIGNNKFARYTTGNEGYGFVVSDCGASGLSSSILADNHLNGVNTALPGGFRDNVLHSAGKMYLISNQYPPDYNKHKLQVCNISNVTGITSDLSEADDIFGPNGTIWYSGSEQGQMQGRAIPGGGAMWIVRRSGIVSPYATDMRILIANGAAVNLYQCIDADGLPLALTIDTNGVFAFAYLTTDYKIRVRVGKLTGFLPTFGDSFDIYDGATEDLYPADMGYFGDGKFLLSVQNFDTNKTDNIAFETDGSTVSCDNTSGSALSVSTAGDSPLMIAQSGYAGKLLIGQLSGSAGRRTKMVGLSADPVTLTDGIGVSVTVDVGKYKYYAILASASVTSVSVDLTGLTADLDLFVRYGSRPNSSVNDGSSENGGTENENVTVDNTEETVWYIGVYGYEAGSGTLTVTLS